MAPTGSTPPRTGTSAPRISYNIGAQVMAFGCAIVGSIGVGYLLYNTVPTRNTYLVFVLLSGLGLFGYLAMIQFWIENQLFKKILTVWQTNHLLLRSLVLTLFIAVGYFLYISALLTFWSVFLVVILFGIYLNWLSNIGKNT
jgi:hypothetical protein